MNQHQPNKRKPNPHAEFFIIFGACLGAAVFIVSMIIGLFTFARWVGWAK